MSFPQQDYLAMLKGKSHMFPPYNQQIPQPQYPFLNYGQPPQLFGSPNQWNVMMPPYMSYPFMMMPQMPMMQQMQQIPQMTQMPTMMQPIPQNMPIAKPQTQISIQQDTQEEKHDESKYVEVDKTKIWLNLKLIRELPIPSEESQEEESILDYDEHKQRIQEVRKPIAKLEKTHFINFRRRNRFIRRGISTRNVKVDEELIEIPVQKLFRKNDGYIRIGSAYQSEIVHRPINLSMMKVKLQNFKIWDQKNQYIYEKIKEQLEYSDDKVVKILNGFTNHKVLYEKIMKKCPITMQEIQKLLSKS